MRNETRNKFNAYREAVAMANGLTVSDTDKKFSVSPSLQQTLETKAQESSSFLQMINIVPVAEQQGERLGLGAASTLASTTDTSTTNRETQSIANIDNITYHCQQINYDSHLTYGQLDQWAKFPDFAARIAEVKQHRIALDRIMIGFNGTSRASTSNRATYPLLQDVGIGWLEKIRTQAPKRHMKEVEEDSGKIYIGKGQHYQNLDALVFSAVTDILEPWFHEDPQLVAIMGRDLLADKYFSLINNNSDKGTEQLANDLIISQKRVGGLPAIRVPSVPAGTILITRLDNLSIYFQEGAMRRTIVENAQRDRVEDYLSSNDAFVVENYDCVALLENIEFKDK
ncbi:phage major capsid protein, P2 family [Avibacterium sp. 20-129]|uniref:phage major capsid protein, P2 family n=1 Tax=Avibacterium sp. 20-129 TaxID=2911525 RepID=UPI0022465669|nr:phage major capsid protein, P2 family [Avibacterium sp. 20-129]MCW9698142.1 phage major capsid protein, P2 family [Avibacterium sp. 20-129]